MKTRRGIVLALATVVLASAVFALAAGCGSEVSPDEQLRQDLESFKTALSAMADPTIYTDQKKFDQAWSDVQSSFKKVVASGKKVKDIRVGQFEEAYDNLEKAIGDVTGEGTLTQKATAITMAIEQLQTAWSQLFNDLGGSK